MAKPIEIREVTKPSEAKNLAELIEARRREIEEHRRQTAQGPLAKTVAEQAIEAHRDRERQFEQLYRQQGLSEAAAKARAKRAAASGGPALAGLVEAIDGAEIPEQLSSQVGELAERMKHFRALGLSEAAALRAARGRDS